MNWSFKCPNLADSSPLGLGGGCVLERYEFEVQVTVIDLDVFLVYFKYLLHR